MPVVLLLLSAFGVLIKSGGSPRPLVVNSYKINSISKCDFGWQVDFWRLHCICASHHFGVRRAASTQQVSGVQHALRDFAQAQALVHGGLAQLVVGYFFREVLPLHQHAFGAVDDFAVL